MVLGNTPALQLTGCRTKGDSGEAGTASDSGVHMRDETEVGVPGTAAVPLFKGRLNSSVDPEPKVGMGLLGVGSIKPT
jgi:hypothetical protein